MNENTTNIKSLNSTNNNANRQNDCIYTHTFASPIDYNGNKFSELTFDFGTLTGNDSLAVESELQASGIFSVMPEITSEYRIRIAARACKESVGSDIFGVMPIKDYNRILGKVRSFLSTTE